MISTISSNTSCPSLLHILNMRGKRISSSCGYSCVIDDIDSRTVVMARRHPKAANTLLSSSSSSSSYEQRRYSGTAWKDCITTDSTNQAIVRITSASVIFQKATLRFWQRPTAYGAISSPNFSTMASRVITRSSFSTCNATSEEEFQRHFFGSIRKALQQQEGTHHPSPHS